MPTRRRWLPTPAVAGATALVVAGIGAVVVSSGAATPSPAAASGSMQTLSVQLGSSDEAPLPTPDRVPEAAHQHRRAVLEAGDVGIPGSRIGDIARVSRDVDRATMQQQTELQAQQRMSALAQLADRAQQRADELESDQWVLPVAGYHLTATFGETSYLWASVHTGLDFAADEGTPIVSVAQGTVTFADYDGAYGNKTVVTLEDGTEIWYCHQSSQTVGVGDDVAPGDVIGAVGSTGNTTGPHLHLEVRPGGDDPVDPYQALVDHGVTP